MRLTLKRFSFLEEATIGRLSLNGKGSLFTLEPKVREIKVPGKTAIPEGIYLVTIDWSPKFNRLMPHINNVPNFQGVRIHYGNTDADSEGCILVGRTWDGADFIGKSRDAFDWLFPLVQEARKQNENVTLEVTS